MANPTTNFGWVMPTSTDLVTDLPADFNVFGQGVDTSLQYLLGGTTGQVLSKTSNTNMAFTWVAQDDSNAIQNAIVDAKGDLIGATAADTPARLAVGTNGQVLTADSTAATGLAWATASAGGKTLLSTTTLSGTSTTVSSISQSYKDLFVLVVNQIGGGGQILLKPNNASNAYGSGATSNNGGATSAYTIYNDQLGTNAYANTSDATNFYMVYINNYASTTAYKPFQYQGGHLTDASVRHNAFSNGYLMSNNAVTSMVVNRESGSFSAGTIYVYGVS
jgi:hypothetical protein